MLPLIGLGFTLVAFRLAHRVFRWPGRQPHFLQRFVTYMWLTFAAWAIFIWTVVANSSGFGANSIWNNWGLALQVPIILAGVLLDFALGHMPPRIERNARTGNNIDA